MEAESRRREYRKNIASCPFSQRLCVDFDVTFMVDAELDNDSINVICGG